MISEYFQVESVGSFDTISTNTFGTLLTEEYICEHLTDEFNVLFSLKIEYNLVNKTDIYQFLFMLRSSLETDKWSRYIKSPNVSIRDQLLKDVTNCKIYCGWSCLYANIIAGTLFRIEINSCE